MAAYTTKGYHLSHKLHAQLEETEATGDCSIVTECLLCPATSKNPGTLEGPCPNKEEK